MSKPIMTNVRQLEMNKLIRERGQVTVNELIETFHVSDMTVRRDLDLLEKNGLIQRIHGGAISLERNQDGDIPLSIRTIKNKPLKEAIAQKAVDLIQNDTSVLLDAGTTTYEMAKLILQKSHFNDLTIITNDINIGHLFSEKPSIHLIMPGGELRSSTQSFVGSNTRQFFKTLNIDQAFIGCSGVSFEKGVMNSNLDEADVKTAMIEASTHVILVADWHKFENQSLVSFAPISRFKCMITNSELPHEMKRRLSEFEFLDVEYV